MKTCKICKTYNADYEKNCPLCGASLVSAPEKEGEFDFAPYNTAHRERPGIIVRNIFIVLSILIVVFLGIAGFLSKNEAIFYIGLTSVVFTWLGVLQFVFFKTNLRSIYFRLATVLILLAVLVCWHFGRLDIAFGYVVPCVLFVLNVTTMLTVFISSRWYRFAFHIFILSIVMIAMLPLTYFLKYNYIASIVVFVCGLTTLLFSFIFGRGVLKEEFKKRFFI